MDKRFSHLLRFFIGIFILSLLLYKIGIDDIAETFSKIDLSWLFVMLPVFASTFYISTLNIWLLVKASGYDAKISRLFRWMSLSWANGQLIPGKVGEFSMVYFLAKNYNLKVGEGTAMVLIDKFITLTMYVIFSAFSVFLFYPKDQAILLAALIIIAAIGGIVIFLSKAGQRIIKRFVWKKVTDKFEKFGATINILLKNPKYIAANILLTLLKMLVFTVYFILAFRAFQQYVPPLYIFLLIALISIISGIPVTISGLGVREGAAVFFYTKLGIPAEKVIGAYLLLVIINYTLVGVIYGLLGHEFMLQKKQN